jgi:hypothetical protein
VSIFRDDYGVRPWVVGVVVMVSVGLLVSGGVIVGMKADLSAAKNQCGRIGQISERETQFVDNGWRGECFIRVNDQWIPLSNWRVN